MTTMIVRAPQAIVSATALNSSEDSNILSQVTFKINEAGIITALHPELLDDAALAAAGWLSDDPAIRDISPDQLLIPGLVDSHVHCNEPGRTAWEGFATATAAAAAGAVTTIVDMPLNSIPPTTTVAALEQKERAARGKTAISVGFWGGIVPETLGTGEIAALWEAGVFGFKCFLADSGVPEFPPLTTAELYAAMEEVAAVDGLLLVHAEDPSVLAEHAASSPEGDALATSPRYADFLATRPAQAEAAAIATVIQAAAQTGCRVHILHLSDANSLPAIAAAKAQGVRLSVETCPHYLSFIAEEIHNGATQVKCCPPIRSAANREKLWQGLVAGVIDTIASDHSPCCAQEKQFHYQEGTTSQQHDDDIDFGGTGMGHTGNGASFLRAWGGIASVQLGFSVVASAAQRRGISREKVIAWMATNPAKLLGLSDRGTLAVGKRADLAVIRPDSAFVVHNSQLCQRNKFSAYSEQALAMRVTEVWLAGQPLNLTKLQQASSPDTGGIAPPRGQADTVNNIPPAPPLELAWGTTYFVHRSGSKQEGNA
ncbi:MAG: allantoinase AllB [Corynebacterium sp.]|nr:allantoinase AllB [Corynebacterium sp.]